MLRNLLGLALVGLLTACSTEPEISRPDAGPQVEKTVYAALTKVAATDEQKVAVLNAYDRSNDHLRELAAESRRIVGEWRELDRLAPDYAGKADALSARWGQLNADEMKTRSTYEHDVAAALGPKQWSQWQDFMRSNRAPRSSDDYGSGGTGLGPGQGQGRRRGP